MFKSSAGKSFFAVLLFFASSCSFWRAGETEAPSPTPLVASEIKSEIPFSTKEPEIYQTEIITRNFGNGETFKQKIFTARNGTRRVTIFNPGETGAITSLELAADRRLSIYPGKRIYTESFYDSSISGETTNVFFTTEWLNQKTPATFENLGTANGLSEFRVKLGNTEKSNSEILIYVDENLKLPVKQEFYSINGEQRLLMFSVEMENFKTGADEKNFELPKDFRKLSPEEFQEIVWQERIKK